MMKTVLSWFKNQRKSQWVDLSSGQAIVIIALAAVGLFAMMGLAIDGGRLFLMKRDTQNAADAAAVAAARALCTGREPAPYALAAAKESGFNDADADKSVQVYSPPITAGIVIEDDCQGCYVEVILKSEMKPAFASIVYKGKIETTSRAVAVCSPDLNGGVVRSDDIRAAWAMAESSSPVGDKCSYPVSITGNDFYAEGGLHSNGELKIQPGGAGGLVVGPTSHSQGYDVKTNKNTEFQDGLTKNDFFAETSTGPCLAACFIEHEKVTCGCWGDEQLFPGTNPYLTPPTYDFPVSYVFDDYTPTSKSNIVKEAKEAGEYHEFNCSGKFYDWIKNNHLDGTKMDNGIYYANCGIELKGLDDTTGNVTIVSTGHIKVQQSASMNWYPYAGDLLLIGNERVKNCGVAVEFAASYNQLNGNIFAPRGGVQISGSGNVFNGCIVGQAVQISGSSTKIYCDPGEQPVEYQPAIWLAQ